MSDTVGQVCPIRN